MRMLKLLGMIFVLSGCVRVDTDPAPVLEKMKQDICCRAGQAIDPCEETRLLLERELTPDIAVAVVLTNNPELRGLYESLGIAKADWAQSRLLANPVVAFAYRFSTDSLISSLIDLSFFQNLIDALLIPLKKKMAAEELEAARLFVTGQILEVIGKTKSTFYSLIAQEKIWALKSEYLAAAEAAYDAANRLFRAGNTNELFLDGKRLEYERIKIELADIEIEILEEREKLNVLMGLFGTEIQWRYICCFPQICDLDLSGIENRSVENSFDLQAARKQMCATAARFGIDTAKTVFPQFDGGVSSERESDVWYAGPAGFIPIPLFDWGKAKVAGAEAAIAQMWNQYTGLAIKIRSAARLGRVELLNAERKIRQYCEVIIPLAERVTQDTLLQYNAMQLGVFDLLAAKQQEIEMKMEAAMTEKEYWLSRTKLEMLIQGHMKDL